VDDFAQAENRAIFAYWQESLNPEDLESVREELDPTLCPRFDLLLEGPRGAPPINDDQARKALIEGGMHLRQRRLQRLVEELHFLQADAESSEGFAVEEYGQMVDSYRSALWNISRALADRSFFGRRGTGTSGLVA
jgi:hypothetical protein